MPVTVALRAALTGRPLAVLSARQPSDLGFHELSDHRRHALTDHVDVLAAQHRLDRPLRSRHPLALGHRGVVSVVGYGLLCRKVRRSRAPWWPTSSAAASRSSYTTSTDLTRVIRVEGGGAGNFASKG